MTIYEPSLQVVSAVTAQHMIDSTKDFVLSIPGLCDTSDWEVANYYLEYFGLSIVFGAMDNHSKIVFFRNAGGMTAIAKLF